MRTKVNGEEPKKPFFANADMQSPGSVGLDFYRRGEYSYGNRKVVNRPACPFKRNHSCDCAVPGDCEHCPIFREKHDPLNIS